MIFGPLRSLTVGAVLLALAALTACGTYPHLENESGTGRGSKPVSHRLEPVDYDTEVSSSQWDSLNSRSRDPRPLTVSEVFGRRKSGSAQALAGKAFGARDVRYTLQGRGHLDSDCSKAVWGEKLKTTMQRYGCTQILRGVYASTSDEDLIAAHIAVFNLRDVVSADMLLEDLDPTHHKGFVKPLPGQAKSLDHFGSAYNAADATAYGHYVVVCWVGFAEGAAKGDSDEAGAAPWSELSRMALEQAFMGFLHSRL